MATPSSVSEDDTNVLESELEVPTDDLTSRKCMLNVFLKCMLEFFIVFFFIFIKFLVTLFEIGGTETTDVLTQMACGRF